MTTELMICEYCEEQIKGKGIQVGDLYFCDVECALQSGLVVECEECGELIEIDNALMIGDLYFCSEDCALDSGLVVKCRECGKLDLGAEHTMYEDTCHDNFVCEECYDNGGYFTCDDCGEITEYGVYHENSDRFYCDDCVYSHLYRCDECGEYFEQDEVYTDDYNHCVCHDCYSTECYVTCADCGELLIEDGAYYSESRGEYFCSNCLPEEEGIKDYSYKPNPIFYGLSNELHLGVELEVDKGNNRYENAQYVQDNLNFTYCKSDSSLENGFEIVTHPCTLAYHMDYMKEYKDVFNYLVEESFRSHDTTTCGLHVHVSRDYLGNTEEGQDLTIAKIMLLMELLWDRGVSNIARRDNVSYAKRNSYIDTDRQATEEEVVESSKRQGYSRYYALNLQNTHTIEFRLFRGTLNTNSYIATLQFVNNLVEFAKEISLKTIQTSTITIEQIINFVEYAELTQYAKERKIITE